MDHAARIGALAEKLGRNGLEAYWAVSTANVRYLCGFAGEDSTLLVTPGRSVLITDSRYLEQAERQAAVDEVISRHASMPETVAHACRALGVRRLGLSAEAVSHARFESLRTAAPTLDVRNASGLVERLRQRKDPQEVEAIRKSLRLAEQAFSKLIDGLEPGQSEGQIAARLEYEMRMLGAEGAAFETICAVGANASMPHARAGATPVRRGEPVLFDWGARLDGYCSDLTRVVATDTIPRELAVLVDVVLDARAAVLEKLKPGVLCGEADAAGRAVIAKAGYGRYFGHSMGHGVGLAVHEGPRVGPGSEQVLLPGMVVTVEPGIYLPGRIGVRIEDMALITPHGHEVLSDLARRPGELTPFAAR